MIGQNNFLLYILRQILNKVNFKGKINKYQLHFDDTKRPKEHHFWSQDNKLNTFYILCFGIIIYQYQNTLTLFWMLNIKNVSNKLL